MQFGPQARIGRYQVGELLGAGGMGEVHRGMDTRLNRPVAIKVLRSDLPPAPELRQRLAHEAHVLSAINHPHICTLYDVLDVDGQPALIMELLEGATLAERQQESVIPVTEVVRIGAQVASALAAAHQKGVLHRDVKPGNIFLTASGHVKVLDFGVAKLWTTGSSQLHIEETRSIESSPVTAPGALLGTLAYMAPEQALGEPIDPRTDIFSLGAVLYELCTGQRPFTGKTLPALIDALLHSDPVPARKRNPNVSAELDAVLRRALQKDPSLRQQSATELEQDLARLAAATGGGGIRTLRWAGALAAILAGGAVATYILRSPQPANAVVSASQATDVSGQELFPHLAPDGKSFLFSSRGDGNNWDIYSQRVAGQTSVNLTADSKWDDTQPAFSADSERIAFRSERDGGGIFVMSATGEHVRKVSDFGYNPSWSPDGNLLVVATEAVVDPVNRGRSSQLWTIEVETGNKALLYEGDAVQPSWSPHGYRIAFWSGVTGQREIRSISAGGRDVATAVSNAQVNWNPAWSSDGRFLYYLSNKGGSMNVWRTGINERSGAVTLPPQPMTTPAIESAHLTIARNANRGAYVQRFSAANIHKVRFDGRKPVGALTQVTRGTKTFLVSDVSANGEWIAFMSSGTQEDLYVVRNDGTGLKQLTNDAHKDRRPRWAPDGKRLMFDSNRTGRFELWQINPDGSGLTQVTHTADPGVLQAVWSESGTEVAFSRAGDVPGFLNLVTGETRLLRQLARPETWMGFTSWSADGKKIAFHTIGAKGPSGVGLYSTRDGSAVPLTTQGAAPIWLADSRRLLYETGFELHLIDSVTRSDQIILRTDPYAIELGSRSGGVRDWIYVSLLSTEADVWTFDIR